jgi:hypothetical protein
MTPAKSVLAVREATFRDHGGELRFYLSWVLGEVDRVVRNWFRRQARNWDELRRDVASLDRPAARLEVRLALEVTEYLVAVDGSPPGPRAAFLGSPAQLSEWEEDSLTSLAMQESEPTVPPSAAQGSGRAPPPRPVQPEIHRRLHQSLFQLLKVVEIVLPAGREVHEAGLLLHHLAGPEAVAEFGRLDRWLQEVRRRAATTQPAAFERLLVWMAADLFSQRQGVYVYRLSFRLYLRARLKAYCRQRGWVPKGNAFRDLDTAFAALGRERIGAVVREAVQEYARDKGEQGQVAVPEVLELLRVSA